jgi:hypothetical protein
MNHARPFSISFMAQEGLTDLFAVFEPCVVMHGSEKDQ